MSPTPNETCWTMLRAAATGDRDARSTFARCYAGPIRVYLAKRWRGTPTAEAIDDAVQDVFVECLKPDGVLVRARQDRGDFRALLYGVVRNVARRFEQRAASGREAQTGESIYLDELPAQQEALSRIFDRAWAQALLREAVSRHEQSSRSGDAAAQRRHRILQMRHQQDMPIRDIARTLDEPDVDAIHNAYRRARREFRTFLRDVVAEQTGALPEHLDAECLRVIDLVRS